MNTLTAGELIGFGWETFKKRVWFLIFAPLLASLIFYILLAASGELAKLGAALAIISFVINLCLQVLFKIGALNFTIKAADNVESVRILDYWCPKPFLQYVLMSVVLFGIGAGVAIASFLIAALIGVVVYFIASSSTAGIAVFLILAVALLIVSLVIVGIMFMLAPLLVIDKNMNGIEAIKESVRMTEGKRLNILWFLFLCLLLNLVGLVCLIVGVLVTSSVTSLALVKLYRTLSQTAPQENVAPVSTT